MRLVPAALALVAAAILVSPSPAPAEPVLPAYDGLLSFRTISGPTDPEESSSRVELQPGQELRAIDDQHAEVYYDDGHVAMSIQAEPARDAHGVAVPTSITVSDGNVVTLTVHHRAGNPAAGGAPFAYPVTPGPSFEVGYSTVIVTGPDDEQKQREKREEQERIAREAATTGPEPVRVCVVPTLKGWSLNADRTRLQEAGCRLGDVRGVRSRTAKVVRQFPVPGTMRSAGAEVAVKLAG